MLLEIRHARTILAQIVDSYRVSNHGKLPVFELTFFLMTPLFLAIFLIYLNITPESCLSDLLAALSIFVGFLINMLIPFFSIIEKTDSAIRQVPPSPLMVDAKLRLQQYRILYVQVSFAVLVSLISIASMLVLKLIPTSFEQFALTVREIHVRVGHITRNGFILVTYWGLGLIFFSVLQILVSANALIYPRLMKEI